MLACYASLFLPLNSLLLNPLTVRYQGLHLSVWALHNALHSVCRITQCCSKLQCNHIFIFHVDYPNVPYSPVSVGWTLFQTVWASLWCTVFIPAAQCICRSLPVRSCFTALYSVRVCVAGTFASDGILTMWRSCKPISCCDELYFTVNVSPVSLLHCSPAVCFKNRRESENKLRNQVDGVRVGKEENVFSVALLQLWCVNEMWLNRDSVFLVKPPLTLA